MSLQQKLEILLSKLERLREQHQHTGYEMEKLKAELDLLKEAIHAETGNDEIPEINIDFENKTPSGVPPPLPKMSGTSDFQQSQKERKLFNLEEFIGGNLINKVGILLLLSGLGLFVKYAIDIGYLTPLVRLVLSFLSGMTLVGIGYWLKPKYKTYSAVLFSGGMAVLYFSTYSSNAFYDPVLMPRMTAFIFMVLFTIVTVWAAALYRLEIIALLGLVGAYAVPFLLSKNSEAILPFLSYIAIINTGVLIVSIRENWRITLYSAIVFTCLIFSFWVLMENLTPKETGMAWLFGAISYFTFYLALISYNILKDKSFSLDNVLFITFNAFVFYGLGIVLLESNNQDNFKGIFTLGNGLIHLAVAFGLSKKLSDKTLFYAVSGLFWVFLTLFIGVQFESPTAAILWMGESAILFGIGRSLGIKYYEEIAFPVLMIGLSYLVQNWESAYYGSPTPLSLFFNSSFLLSTLAMIIIGTKVWMHRRWQAVREFPKVLGNLVVVIFLLVIYFSFLNEIYHQFEQAFFNSEIDNVRDGDILDFRNIWLINYTLFCLLVLVLVNRFYLNETFFAKAITLLSIVTILAFLSSGIFILNHLRNEFLNPGLNPMHPESSYWIWIRYLSYCFVAALLIGVYQLGQYGKWNIFQLFVFFVILVILSNELTTFMTIVVGVDSESLTHKVGFSILWAIYSLFLILRGFRKRLKLMRIAGIFLFAITLLKVFFVDLTDISTESRILLFVAIGIILLLTSYFYQRYRHIILGGKEN